MRISSDLKIIGLSELNKEKETPVTVLPPSSKSRQEEENVSISDPLIDEESKIVYSQIARDVQETLSWIIPQRFDCIVLHNQINIWFSENSDRKIASLLSLDTSCPLYITLIVRVLAVLSMTESPLSPT